MLAVLLSFGAVNSLIPLLIIIMLIAAAAGLTRGYDLFAIFGIGTLVGAASAAKKGSVVGRNPYKAAYKSQFMPKPKSRKEFKAGREAKREERKEIEEDAERTVKVVNQLPSKTAAPILAALETANYLENPNQKGTYVNLKGTAAKFPTTTPPAKGYLEKVKFYSKKKNKEAVKAKVKNPAMTERELYLHNLATAVAAEIEQLVLTGEWNKMSDKQKIAFVEKKFVRPVKGQRSKVAMVSALLRGDINGFKEEFNKAPSSSKALIGIMVALATGAGVGGAKKAIINELKKMPNYGAQTQPSRVSTFGGPQAVGFGGTPVLGFGGTPVLGFGGPQGKGKSKSRVRDIIKSYAPFMGRLTSLVFLGPLGWFFVTAGSEEVMKKIRQRQQKATP